MQQTIIPDQEPVTQREEVVTRTTQDNVVVNQTPQAYQTKKVIFRAYQVIWYILGIIEVLLAFRFVLRFIAANSSSGFAALIYSLSAPFAVPFRGLVSSTVTGQSVFEWSTLIAMVVYLILAYGLVKLFQFVKPTNPVEVETTVNTQV
jgi:uncharacterized protein YggT (Ycf19 family)